LACLFAAQNERVSCVNIKINIYIYIYISILIYIYIFDTYITPIYGYTSNLNWFEKGFYFIIGKQNKKDLVVQTVSKDCGDSPT
jgi:hypothetical protein